jgi:hypothetical protein
MSHPFVCSQCKCVLPTLTTPESRELPSRYSRGTVFGVLIFLAFASVSAAFGQIQSTISCPAGQGNWDVLSVMMMDPGLAAGYHMEGITNGLPSAYIYTLWDESQGKVYYTKNPQGNPWDVNLYDSNYIYQWVTELQTLNNVNYWNDPASCKKFNNGSGSATADYSMRWAARCAVPGGAGSSFWNSPASQPNNTNYYTYVNGVQQSQSQNLGYALLELKPANDVSVSVVDHRANPPKQFPISTLPLYYTYSCTVAENVNSCQAREVFEYGFDTTVNPVDNVRHSYGWVGWRYYVNATLGNPELPAVWTLSNSSVANQLMPGQVNVNFACFE